MSLVDPIAERHRAITPVDGVVSEAARDPPLNPDSGVEFIIGFIAFRRRASERSNIFQGWRAVHPWQPCTQTRAVRLYQCKDGFGVGLLHQPQLDPRRDYAAEHYS